MSRSKSFFPVSLSPGASGGSVPAGLRSHGGVPAAHQRRLTGEGQGLLPQTQVRYATLHHSRPPGGSRALRMSFTLKGELTPWCCISRNYSALRLLFYFPFFNICKVYIFKVGNESFIQTGGFKHRLTELCWYMSMYSI